MACTKTLPKVVLKDVHEVADEYQNATLDLDLLPATVQMIIDRYGLHQRELTESQKRTLGNDYECLYNNLMLIQRTLERMKTEVNAITLRK